MFGIHQAVACPVDALPALARIERSVETLHSCVTAEQDLVTEVNIRIVAATRRQRSEPQLGSPHRTHAAQ